MSRLIIDWSHSPTYTTTMGVFAGCSLIAVASLGRKLFKRELNLVGWALNLGVLGIVLLITGANTVVNWPLNIPYDNILFGEPTLALGVLDLGLAFYLWKRIGILERADAPVQTVSQELYPFRTLLTGMGLVLICVACAAYRYRIFVAPKEEPLSGDFAVDHPIAENVGIATMFLLVGVAAILAAVFLSDFSKGQAKLKWYHQANYLLLQLAGWVFVIGGAFVVYTHVGLIIGTAK